MLAHQLSILADKERELRAQLLDDRNSASNSLVVYLKLDDWLVTLSQQGSILQADIDDWSSKGRLVCL